MVVKVTHNESVIGLTKSDEDRGKIRGSRNFLAQKGR